MMGVLPSIVNGFIYSYLARGNGSGGWPKMGSKIELELCFRLIRDTAYLRDLRSWIECRTDGLFRSGSITSVMDFFVATLYRFFFRVRAHCVHGLLPDGP